MRRKPACILRRKPELLYPRKVENRASATYIFAPEFGYYTFILILYLWLISLHSCYKSLNPAGYNTSLSPGNWQPGNKNHPLAPLSFFPTSHVFNEISHRRRKELPCRSFFTRYRPEHRTGLNPILTTPDMFSILTTPRTCSFSIGAIPC